MAGHAAEVATCIQLFHGRPRGTVAPAPPGSLPAPAPAPTHPTTFSDALHSARLQAARPVWTLSRLRRFWSSHATSSALRPLFARDSFTACSAHGEVTGPAPTADMLASGTVLRAWKLWRFLPRMLLFRPGQCPKNPDGAVACSLHFLLSGGVGPTFARRPAPGFGASRDPSADPTPQQRADRAVQLAHLGELSAARQALTAEPLAPATDATPPLAAARTLPALAAGSAAVPAGGPTFTAAAPGPSGYTAEILRVLLDDDECSACFADVSSLLASPLQRPSRSAAWLPPCGREPWR